MDAHQLGQYMHNNSLCLLVRPSAKKTMIKGWDGARKALRVDIAAPPENNKANIEVIKFFSKLLKKKVIIVRGLTRRKKLLRIEEYDAPYNRSF